MSLEKILDCIHADGERQAAEIRQQAEQEVRSVQAQARKEAGAIYQAARRDALRPAEGACARLRNEARFEAECLLGAASTHFIDSSLESLRRSLEHIRESDNYSEALRGLLLEILPGLNGRVQLGQRIHLQADPRDRPLLEQLLREEGLDVPVDYCLNCWGGLIMLADCEAQSESSTRVVNTLESRLERALPYLRNSLAAMFEAHTAAVETPAPAEKEQPA